MSTNMDVEENTNVVPNRPIPNDLVTEVIGNCTRLIWFVQRGVLQLCKQVTMDRIDGKTINFCEGQVFGNSLHTQCHLRTRGSGGVCVPFQQLLVAPSNLGRTDATNCDHLQAMLIVHGKKMNAWAQSSDVSFLTIYGTTDWSRVPVGTIIDVDAVGLYSRVKSDDFVFPPSACVAEKWNYDHTFFKNELLRNVSVTSFTHWQEIKLVELNAWSVCISPFLSVENFVSHSHNCYNIDYIPMDRLVITIHCGQRDEMNIPPKPPTEKTLKKENVEEIDSGASEEIDSEEEKAIKTVVRCFYGSFVNESEFKVSCVERIFTGTEFSFDVSYNSTEPNNTLSSMFFLAAVCYLTPVSEYRKRAITKVRLCTDRLPWCEEIRIADGYEISKISYLTGAVLKEKGEMMNPNVREISYEKK